MKQTARIIVSLTGIAAMVAAGSWAWAQTDDNPLGRRDGDGFTLSATVNQTPGQKPVALSLPANLSRAYTAEQLFAVGGVMWGKGAADRVQARRDAGIPLAQTLAHYVEQIRGGNNYLRAVQQIHPGLAKAAVGGGAAGSAAATTPARGRVLPMDEMVVLFDRSIPVAGMSTSLGSGALKELSATRDSQVAARLTAAGAVILGHTNGDELHGLVGSHLPAGYSWLGGQVVDARDALWRSPGHGATGAAVAMAAGWADLAVVYGTPQQITEPAAIAGLYAAVLPRRCGIQGAVPAVGPQGHLGIIGRTPEDVALGQLVLCRSGIDTTNHAGDGGREDTTAAGTADSASTDSTTDTGTTVGARNSQPAGVKVTARRPRSAARTLTLVSAEDDPHIINAGKAHNLLFIPPTAQMNDLRRALADLPLDAATRVLGAQELDGWLAAQKKGPAGLTELAAFYADHPQQAPYGHDLIDAVADGREMSVDQAHAVVAEAEKLNRQLADLVRGAGAEGMMERGLGPFPLADADATRITVPFGEVNPNLAGDAYGDLSFVVTAFGRDSDEVAFTATRRLADGRADRF